VAQILAASSYPTQIVEAHRFLDQNPDLKGRALGDAIDQQDWDPSVKAICQFPSVLANLDKDLSWTQELGDANYNQSADVMQAIQYMRHKAQDAGNLKTTPQQRVIDRDDDQVEIDPGDPDTVYVPQYNPAFVYGYPVGVWPGFYPWWGFGGPYISFGFGFPISPFFGFGWGWHGWGLGWGFHGGVFFGGHPYAWHGGGFYSHNAFVHGNYRGFSRGGYGARGYAGGHGYAARGYAGGHGYAGRGYASNRGFSGNRGYAGADNHGGVQGHAPSGASHSGGQSHSSGGHSSPSGGHSSGGGGHSSGGGGGHSGGGGHGH
jgi:hypothetical protein